MIVAHAEPTRPTPAVFLIPPWGARTPAAWYLATAGMLAVGLVTSAIALANVKRGGFPWFVVGVCLIPTAILVFVFLLGRGKHVRQRDEFVQQYRDVLDLQQSAAFERVWRDPVRIPTADRYIAVVRRNLPQSSSRAVILCVGTDVWAAAEDDRFEPIIYTPTAQLGLRLVEPLIALVIVSVWLLSWAGWLPWRLSPGCFLSVLPVVVIGLVRWIWTTGVRPRYVRLAPGMIQFVQYGAKTAPAQVRSYPMTAGTLVVITRRLQDCVLSVCRDGRHDELRVSSMVTAHEVQRWIWRAMLSTAPTPPLSDEDLIG